MDDVVTQLRGAIAGGDRERARLLLHPYLQWSPPDGTVVRGRAEVLALLRDGPVPEPPVSAALRDGQVYRWVCPPAG
ncbi:nuclear transport factor 2 family protein [Motilibacter deserti]|uniref:Nuclear transport factor 2 family protein n=1 Tax=Motilibacter deserti TaxID=2714956 RepID=A0ABX0H0C1_9ACTN|nr:nuclear transport factor 2 family protein [Motilibacter deserti]NHC15275.1 nuclear transport factor 2 family protein [Motilibacter deserti]